MIHQLHLRYFRKHEDLTLNFSRGLNTLRGPNESGKSTTAEGILYAFFGSKTLRNPLADTVTWDRKESELRVRLVYSVGKKAYTFERSKGGASVHLGGEPFVTGQNEVTAFATELLGADAKTASMLMMASQADLRGAMDEGPSAVSGLIARLADFDTVDMLLARASERLLTGSEAPFAQRLEETRQRLADLGEAPQPQGYGERAAAAQALYEEKAKAIPGLQQEAADAAQALGELRTYNAAVEDWTKELTRLQQAALSKTERIATLDTIIAAAPTATAIAAADTALAQARDVGRLAAVYAKVQALPAYPTEFWDAPKESFDAEVSQLSAKLQAATATVAELKGKLNAARAKRMDEGRCPTCGSTKHSAEHVAKHNSAVAVEVADLDAQVLAAEASRKAVQDEINGMLAVDRKAAPFTKLAAELSGQDLPILIDEKVFPPVISWVGSAPDSGLLAKALAARDALTRQQTATAQAEGERAAAMRELETLGSSTLRLQQALQEKPLKDPTALVEALEARQLALGQALQVLNELRDQAADLKAKHAEEARAIESFNSTKLALVSAAEQLEKDIKTIAFNNNLMKKLKALKPSITDALWSTVLASVSTFFTQIRGEASVVTKEASGFRINGRSIDSFSGSTLDALAVATRVALTKTFIPHAPFLSLDEPAHGADDARTGNLLGFLASCGFDQVLLATHDPLSDAVADNVILLGGSA